LACVSWQILLVGVVDLQLYAKLMALTMGINREYEYSRPIPQLKSLHRVAKNIAETYPEIAKQRITASLKSSPAL